jgi:hypothetical protein
MTPGRNPAKAETIGRGLRLATQLFRDCQSVAGRLGHGNPALLLIALRNARMDPSILMRRDGVDPVTSDVRRLTKAPDFMWQISDEQSHT